MCRICKDVRGLSTADALQFVGEAMGGASRAEQDHLLDLADSLDPLDPELSTFEGAMDADWERSYRGGT